MITSFPNAAQDVVGFVWVHRWLIVSLVTPRILLCRTDFQLVDLQALLVPGIIPTQMQYFAFSFTEITEILLSPILQPVQILLNASTTF